MAPKAKKYKPNFAIFFIDGIPQPWRSPSRYGRHAAPNPKTKRWQEAARIKASKHAPRIPHRGPVLLNVTFHVLRPKTVKNYYPITRSSFDRSNMLKALEDSFNKMFYNDDSQIIGGETSKIYSDRPGARIEIIYLENL